MLLTEEEANEAKELVNALRAADENGDLIAFGKLLRSPKLPKLLRAFPQELEIILSIKKMWDGYLDTPV